MKSLEMTELNKLLRVERRITITECSLQFYTNMFGNYDAGNKFGKLPYSDAEKTRRKVIKKLNRLRHVRQLRMARVLWGRYPR